MALARIHNNITEIETAILNNLQAAIYSFFSSKGVVIEHHEWLEILEWTANYVVSMRKNNRGIYIGANAGIGCTAGGVGSAIMPFAKRTKRTKRNMTVPSYSFQGNTISADAIIFDELTGEFPIL